MPTILPRLLNVGLQPNRIRLVDQGDPLTRFKDAFELLRQNQLSGEKLAVKISA